MNQMKANAIKMVKKEKYMIKMRDNFILGIEHTLSLL